MSLAFIFYPISTLGFVLNNKTFIFLVTCIKVFLIVAIAILLTTIAIIAICRFVLHMMQNGASANNSASAGGSSGGNNNGDDDAMRRIKQQAADKQARKTYTKAKKKADNTIELDVSSLSTKPKFTPKPKFPTLDPPYMDPKGPSDAKPFNINLKK